MPYNHAGEIGDVWKHLPLCDILTIENPIRYHESNSAYSGYTITKNPKKDYGIFHLLEEKAIKDSRYFDTLKRNSTSSFLRSKWIAVAACLVLLISTVSGLAIHAEAKEYDAAISFFNEYSLTTEGLSCSFQPWRPQISLFHKI